MNKTRRAREFAAIKDRHEAASPSWNFEPVAGRMELQSARSAKSELMPLCLFETDHNAADFNMLACAHGDIAFLLDLLNQTFGEVRRLQIALGAVDAPVVDKVKDYTTHASIACNSASFRKFLTHIHGFQPPEDVKAIKTAAAEHLCATLEIDTRKDLNAHHRWLKLNGEFKVWERDGAL